MTLLSFRIHSQLSAVLVLFLTSTYAAAENPTSAFTHLFLTEEQSLEYAKSQGWTARNTGFDGVTSYTILSFSESLSVKNALKRIESRGWQVNTERCVGGLSLIAEVVRPFKQAKLLLEQKIKPCLVKDLVDKTANERYWHFQYPPLRNAPSIEWTNEKYHIYVSDNDQNRESLMRLPTVHPAVQFRTISEKTEVAFQEYLSNEAYQDLIGLPWVKSIERSIKPTRDLRRIPVNPVIPPDGNPGQSM